MVRRKPPDDLDLQILSALDQLGGKASTEVLAEILTRPARTIRYRLSKLKKAGYLKFLYAMTHDRKLGLGDALITLDLAPGISNLETIFHNIPLFYLYGSTIGLHNGYLAHFTYPTNLGDLPERLCKVLQSRGLIKDYSIFDTIDIIFSAGQVERLDVRSGWQWDWQEWVSNCNILLQKGKTSELPFEYDVSRAKFDAKDITILSYLKNDAAITLKDLSAAIGLSQTQVNKRIKRMEHDGIIKGYRWTTEPHEEPFFVYLYFKVERPGDPIISCLFNLPFPKEMLAHSETTFLSRLMLYPSNMISFLHGFERIRGRFKSYHFQLVHNLQSLQMGQLFSSFNAEQNDWDVDAEHYIHLIENFKSPSIT